MPQSQKTENDRNVREDDTDKAPQLHVTASHECPTRVTEGTFTQYTF